MAPAKRAATESVALAVPTLKRPRTRASQNNNEGRPEAASESRKSGVKPRPRRRSPKKTQNDPTAQNPSPTALGRLEDRLALLEQAKGAQEQTIHTQRREIATLKADRQDDMELFDMMFRCSDAVKARFDRTQAHTIECYRRACDRVRRLKKDMEDESSAANWEDRLYELEFRLGEDTGRCDLDAQLQELVAHVEEQQRSLEILTERFNVLSKDYYELETWAMYEFDDIEFVRGKRTMLDRIRDLEKARGAPPMIQVHYGHSAFVNH